MKKNSFLQTSSQTVGPFFAYGLTAEQYQYDFPSLVTGSLIKTEMNEERISIKGRVIDGKGVPLNDAMIEILQADPQGLYRTDPNGDFFGFGRMGTGTEKTNTFNFETYKPGKINKGLAPHINIIVFARGMLNHLFTRMYFSDEKEENDKDLILNQIGASLRSRLIANKVGDGDYHFDIFLQGEKETVFFDI